MVMEEEEITPEKLLGAVHELYENKDKYTKAMKASPQSDAVVKIIELIKQTSK
jgi:UDP-N-acetylglucosamine--N-acetylmuramyl-(pentapeptide) pyrophosphoryl-undecaprenol N-acetylglucosamine transferase